jgi:hypothetical protein
VDDQVGALELGDARLRQTSAPARQVRVGDDRDAGQRAGASPQPTLKGVPTRTLTREGFIAAARRTA